MKKVILLDGILFQPSGEPLDNDAPYFTDVEEAQRWLDENKIEVEIQEA
jgi:hypothetical protein